MRGSAVRPLTDHLCCSAVITAALHWCKEKHRDPAGRGVDNSWSRNIPITCRRSASEGQTCFYHTFNVTGDLFPGKQTNWNNTWSCWRIKTCSLWNKEANTVEHALKRSSVKQCLVLHSVNAVGDFRGWLLSFHSFWTVDVIGGNFLFGRGQLNIWFLLPSNLWVWLVPQREK